MLTLPALAIVFLVASSALQNETQPAPQTYCPVTTEEPIDPEIHTDFDGRRVYFCCDRCRIKFEKNPQEYAHNLPPHAAPRTRGDDHDTRPQPTQHDEQEHARSNADCSPWLKWLGGFHPAMVHFPIGVLAAGALAEILFITRRTPEFDHVARFCVAFATITGVLSALLGWLFAGIRLTDPDPLLALHRWLGTGASLCLAALFALSERCRRPTTTSASRVHRLRLWYRVVLFGGTAVVLVTGFFGGALVYGLDHYAIPDNHGSPP